MANAGTAGESRESQRQETAARLDELLPDLDALGVSPEDMAALQQSAQRLRDGGGQINAARVEAEFRQILKQLEKLEVQLSNNASPTVSGADNQILPGELTETAAEYYRRLSEQPVRLQR